MAGHTVKIREVGGGIKAQEVGVFTDYSGSEHDAKGSTTKMESVPSSGHVHSSHGATPTDSHLDLSNIPVYGVGQTVSAIQEVLGQDALVGKDAGRIHDVSKEILHYVLSDAMFAKGGKILVKELRLKLSMNKIKELGNGRLMGETLVCCAPYCRLAMMWIAHEELLIEHKTKRDRDLGVGSGDVSAEGSGKGTGIGVEGPEKEMSFTMKRILLSEHSHSGHVAMAAGNLHQEWSGDYMDPSDEFNSDFALGDEALDESGWDESELDKYLSGLGAEGDSDEELSTSTQHKGMASVSERSHLGNKMQDMWRRHRTYTKGGSMMRPEAGVEWASKSLIESLSSVKIPSGKSLSARTSGTGCPCCYCIGKISSQIGASFGVPSPYVIDKVFCHHPDYVNSKSNNCKDCKKRIQSLAQKGKMTV
jgi:hypothetical protein